ncbi:glycosyltransferase family 2 protein [Desulfocucumis palustris]|nr:glycosyltransferase family 2 protein [Desulfocucumis palustris]
MDSLKIDNEGQDYLFEDMRVEKEPDDCGIVIKNTDGMGAPEPGNNIYATRRNVAAAFLGEHSSLVSVVLVGYNNLEEYTKTCVECVIKYTKDIDYELILVDNGSSDGTFEYFKSVRHPRKKIVRVTKNIGAFYGSSAGMALAAGAYVAGVCNDVYVTKNWLSNMLKCALSDERIGMIGPMSNNVSNLQDANMSFTDFNDMQEKAGQFNVSDPGKWHERLRLTSPLVLFKKECIDMAGTFDYGFFHDFADDDITFRVRRAGYKAILCKDVFVYHAGHSVSQTAEQYRESLEKGRIAFRNKYFGVDAWDDVNNYELAMMSLINPEERRGSGKIDVLGVDVLCGTPILELKNKLRDAGIFDVCLWAFTNQAKYWQDLNTICAGKVAVDRQEYLLKYFAGDKFDYIVLGGPINGYGEPYRFLEDLLKLLKSGGHLLVKLRNTYDAKALLEMAGRHIAGEQKTFAQISLETFLSYLNEKGVAFGKIMVELHRTDENSKNYIKQLVGQLGISNPDNIFNRIMINDYVLDIFPRANPGSLNNYEV